MRPGCSADLSNKWQLREGNSAMLDEAGGARGWRLRWEIQLGALEVQRGTWLWGSAGVGLPAPTP